LRDDLSDEAIAQTLSERFDVDPVTAQPDVADFRASLKSLGLL
jgi:hypothetical protein